MNWRRHFAFGLFLAAAAGFSAFAVGPQDDDLVWSKSRRFDSKLKPMQLHVKGTRVLNARNEPAALYGVNIASLEWRNDGDHVAESVEHVIKQWKANLIRLPLAQDRWFGKMPDQTDHGLGYRAMVDWVVDFCASNHTYVVVDLHWSDCGVWINEGGKLGQHNMPDAHSIEFWRDAATRYKNFPNVIFGLYNEPHHILPKEWRDGGEIIDTPAAQSLDQTSTKFQAVGMQKLYDTARKTGAKNLVTVSGNDWGYDLSAVAEGYAIKGRDFVYETHPYPMKPNWDKSFGDISKKFAVYIGEWGATGTAGIDYGRRLMAYAKERNLIWTAWDFHPTAGPPLIRDWSFRPTLFGQFVKDCLAEKAAARETELAGDSRH